MHNVLMVDIKSVSHYSDFPIPIIMLFLLLLVQSSIARLRSSNYSNVEENLKKSFPENYYTMANLVYT